MNNMQRKVGYNCGYNVKSYAQNVCKLLWHKTFLGSPGHIETDEQSH